MKNKFYLFTILFFIIFQSFGQAFDGYGDRKMFFGASFQSKAVGLTYFYEGAMNDYFSYGSEIGFVVKSNLPTTYQADWDYNGDGVVNNEDQIEIDESSATTEKIYLALRLNGHLTEALKMGEKSDLYLGVNIGKNFGAQVGGRYMFGEVFGINLEANVPIISNVLGSLTGIGTDDNVDNYYSFYEKVFLNFGAVINL